MARPALEIADIFRDHGPAWRKANAGHVSLGQLKVMSAIEGCRTAALGGHVMRCEDCLHTQIAYNSCLMGKFRNGELATGLGRQSSVFQMVRRRSACLLLSITAVVRRDRPTGDRAPGRHKVFATCRRGSDARNLRPPKSACAVDPDEKLEAIEATGPPALRKRPFDLRTADCRPKGRSVMESQISKIYAPSNAAGRQLPITEFAHKTAVVSDDRVRAVFAARHMAIERRRAAALDGRHHLHLVEADVTDIGTTPRRSEVAENIRDLQCWAGHGRGLLCRRRVLLARVGLLAGLPARL